MTKLILALGLTFAASTGAFARSTALDAYDVPAASGAIAQAVGVSNDRVRYDRAGNDGSPTFLPPQGDIDFTATASIGGVSNDHVVYNRAGNDGSPSFVN